MAAVDERDKILKKYMNEWDELNLDLIVTPASLMPAPLKVEIMFDQIRPPFSWSIFLRAVRDHVICYNLNWPKIKL